MEHTFKHEQLPSGKIIQREFDQSGSLVREQHAYGIADIGISYDFKDGRKIDETYFAKRRMVSRRTYEKARVAYPDMPPSDNTIEDTSGSLLSMVRRQQKQNKAEAENRFQDSAASKFPRPASTNWLRIIAGEKSHLVTFESRDWKLLLKQTIPQMFPTGREWLHQFGFDGTVPGPDNGGCVSKGLEVGFEETGNRKTMLEASRALLIEINNYVANPPEVSRWSGSVRPRRKPSKPPIPTWATALPPLIEFLESIQDSTVIIFNHHR